MTEGSFKKNVSTSDSPTAIHPCVIHSQLIQFLGIDNVFCLEKVYSRHKEHSHMPPEGLIDLR